MKSVLTIAVVAGLIYFLIVVFYALMQRSLIYYPTTVTLDQARQQAQMLGGDAWLDSDGQWLGWSVKPVSTTTDGQTKRAVVFHGNAGMALDRGYYADLMSGFSQSGPWEVYIFEYPGYGPRRGSPSEDAVFNAAANAVDELMALDSTPMLMVGESIGSGTASELTRLRPEAVAALMLITPFDSMVNVANHYMPYLPASLLLKDRYDNLEALSHFQKPLIVVTADNDTIIPTKFAQPLLEQHTGPKMHQRQPEAGHNTLHFNPNQSPWPEVDRFLAMGQGSN